MGNLWSLVRFQVRVGPYITPTHSYGLYNLCKLCLLSLCMHLWNKAHTAHSRHRRRGDSSESLQKKPTQIFKQNSSHPNFANHTFSPMGWTEHLCTRNEFILFYFCKNAQSTHKTLFLVFFCTRKGVTFPLLFPLRIEPHTVCKTRRQPMLDCTENSQLYGENQFTVWLGRCAFSEQNSGLSIWRKSFFPFQK